MLNHVEVTPTKTYANEANMLKAVAKALNFEVTGHVRFFTAWTKEGRCFPIFVGADAASNGIHFHFNIVA
jgi:hypothetical protein